MLEGTGSSEKRHPGLGCTGKAVGRQRGQSQGPKEGRYYLSVEEGKVYIHGNRRWGRTTESTLGDSSWMSGSDLRGAGPRQGGKRSLEGGLRSGCSLSPQEFRISGQREAVGDF